MTDEDDGLGPVGSMAVGGFLLLLGYWMWQNGGGSCVTLVFLDSCLLGGSTFGLLSAGLGGLLLLGGYVEYTEKPEAEDPEPGRAAPGEEESGKSGPGDEAPEEP